MPKRKTNLRNDIERNENKIFFKDFPQMIAINFISLLFTKEQ